MNYPQDQVVGTAAGGSYLYLPPSTVFGERAARFQALAQNHSLADYLQFLAALSESQQTALAHIGEVSLPSTEQQGRCREHGIPVLAVHGWQRDAAWREALRQILAEMQSNSVMPWVARDALARLQSRPHADWESMADVLLAGDFPRRELDLAVAPFVAAALQVYWVRMANMLGANAFARNDRPMVCPVCGSPPVASKVRIGTDHGLRYAVCSLCLAEWNVVRIKCVHCESTKGITYYGIAGGSEAVKAEWCPDCSTYLKIMYMNKSPDVDPVADDVATLALDVLMSEEGKTRYGLNFFLLTGETAEQEQEAPIET